MTDQSPQETSSYFSTLSEQQKVQFREWGDLFSLSNNRPPEGVDIGTVVMPTGDWLDRLRPSLDVFHEAYQAQEVKPHLVITGANSFNVNRIGASAPKIVSHLQSLNLSEEEKQYIIAEEQAEHAGHQAKYVYDMVKAGRIKQPLVLVVSAYHLPRLYSNFVKTIMDNEGENLTTKIYAIPVHKNWKGTIPFEPEKTRREQIIPEMSRIHDYRELGHVATRDQLEQYVGWLNSETTVL